MPDLLPFANEPVLELRRAGVRAEIGDVLERLDRQLPLSVPVMVGVNGDVDSTAELHSTDPGEPDRLVARVASAGLDQCRRRS